MNLFGIHFGRNKLSAEEKRLKELIEFAPEQHEAVIRASICTGEKVAGFKNRETGHFTEVMLIRNQEDQERFQRIFGIEEIKIEY